MRRSMPVQIWDAKPPTKTPSTTPGIPNAQAETAAMIEADKPQAHTTPRMVIVRTLGLLIGFRPVCAVRLLLEWIWSN